VSCFLRLGFIRGTAEQWIKEGTNAANRSKLSCQRFKDNAVRLQLFAMAYNLATFLRQLVLPKSVQSWTLREKPIKIGAKVVIHSKCVLFQLAEVAVRWALFAAILTNIGRLRLACDFGVRLAAFVKSIRSSFAIAAGCCGAPMGSFSMTQSRRNACVKGSGPLRTRPKRHPGRKIIAGSA
jgi:hypothetical protein